MRVASSVGIHMGDPLVDCEGRLVVRWVGRLAVFWEGSFVVRRMRGLSMGRSEGVEECRDFFDG